MQFVNLLIIKLGDYWNKSPRSKFIANSYLNFYILLPIKFRENIVFELNFQNSDFMDRHLFKNPEFQITILMVGLCVRLLKVQLRTSMMW